MDLTEATGAVVLFRLYLGPVMADERRVKLADGPEAVEQVAVHQGNLAAAAVAAGQTYMVEVVFPDGEHIRWGTDPGGMTLPTQVSMERLGEKLCEMVGTQRPGMPRQ